VINLVATCKACSTHYADSVFRDETQQQGFTAVTVDVFEKLDTAFDHASSVFRQQGAFAIQIGKV